MIVGLAVRIVKASHLGMYHKRIVKMLRSIGQIPNTSFVRFEIFCNEIREHDEIILKWLHQRMQGSPTEILF